MRLSAMILLWAMCLSTAVRGQRTELHLFQYGRTNTPQAQAAFLDFRDLLAANLPILSQEVSHGHDISTLPESLSQLKLTSIMDANHQLQRPEGKVGSLAQRRKYWRDTGALGLLTGHVGQTDNIPQVHTQFYWGTLGGGSGQESIELTLPVVGAAFDNTNDSHAIAVLYALAHDTPHTKCQQISGSIYLLSEAHKRALAVQSDLPEIGSRLITLVNNAINKIRHDCQK